MHDLHVIHRLNARAAGRAAGMAESAELLASIEDAEDDEVQSMHPGEVVALVQEYEHAMRRGRNDA